MHPHRQPLKLSHAVLIQYRNGMSHPLDVDALDIGRSKYNNLQVPDDQMMSRRHARLERREGRWFIRDLGSMNGTRVEERLLAPHEVVPLEDDASIQLGDTQFRFVDRETFHYSRDSLTKVWRKAVFLPELEEVFATSGLEASVVLVNVDHMRTLNDRHGFPAGNQFLKQLAAMLDAHVPDRGLTARIAGDWFALLLPDCTKSRAFELAESIRSEVAELTFVFDGERFDATVSMAVAATDEVPRERDVHLPLTTDLMRLVDERLMDAAHGGRNRVVG